MTGSIAKRMLLSISGIVALCDLLALVVSDAVGFTDDGAVTVVIVIVIGYLALFVATVTKNALRRGHATMGALGFLFSALFGALALLMSGAIDDLIALITFASLTAVALVYVIARLGAEPTWNDFLALCGAFVLVASTLITIAARTPIFPTVTNQSLT